MNTNWYMFAAVTVALLFVSTPMYASEIDNRIESAARNSYIFKNYLKDDAIRVSSKDGAVTLTGTVAQESHSALVRDTVQNLPGVKSVDNQLQLKEVRLSENSDSWLGVRIKTALLYHRNVNAFETQIDVKDGMVTLRGKADSLAQKDLTTEYAKDIEGVKGVNNEMVVVETPKKPSETMGEKIDDASITAQIKMTLLFHRSTSALSTKVETNEGIVTLSGKAKNSAERELVAKLVSDIQGVKSVMNNIAVE